MILIRLERTKNTLSVKAQGHALFAPKGKDIVCAAVSILIQNWRLSCDALCSGVRVRRFDDGFFFAESATEPTEIVLWKSLALGLQMLASRYPENMKIILEESNGS